MKFSEEISDFIQSNKNHTPEEIKKALKKKYPGKKIYQDDVEKFIIKSMEDKKSKKLINENLDIEK